MFRDNWEKNVSSDRIVKIQIAGNFKLYNRHLVIKWELRKFHFKKIFNSLTVF